VQDIFADGLGSLWPNFWPFSKKRRKADRLRDFEADARQQAELFGPLNRRKIGIRTVDINQIVGSSGRATEFDADFQPRDHTASTRGRFQSVLRAMKKGELMPPVELYKLRRWYYVLDGHHRLGAAHVLGMEAIEAEVTVFIPSRDPDAVRLFHERQAFEQATGLRSIGAARPRTYRRLLVEVHAYRRELAFEQGEAVELQTAALLWYARVFLPAFVALRSSTLKPFFPALRHADILAALWEEQRTMQNRLQAAAGLSDAAPETPVDALSEQEEQDEVSS